MDISSYTSISSLNTRMSDTSSDYSYKSTDSSIRLEEHIKIHHLRMLLQNFQNHVPMNLQGNVANEKGLQSFKSEDETTRVSQKPGMMTLAEFKVIISKMLGTPKWNDQMEMLFYKVDTGCDGYVDWNEFCTYMVLQMREVEHIQISSQLKPFTTEAIVKRAYHNKQETTTKMFLVENPTRIVNISKVGDIGVWDTELRLLKTYKLSANFTADEAGARRRCHTWVTDGVYMRNSQKFALTTTSREIYFYDTSTNPYYAEFCLFALPDVPNCVNYWYSETARNGHSVLIFGDDEGSVHLLHFRSPQSRLFEKPFNPKQGIQRIYFNDLKDHRKFVTYECISNIHEDIIRRVMYVPRGNEIISSSSSSTTSVVLMDLKRKRKPYIFKVNKGVECFDYCKDLNVLVTGSLDHLVRIWNPYVEAKPICILQGHSTGICDVVINRSFRQIVSYSKDAILKVWDIKEQNCIQMITLKIPSLQPGRIPDHGEFPVGLFEQPHDMMLVSCNDCIALLKMGKLKPPPEAPTTHEAPLCNAIYNDLFHQVVTAADDSTVTVWNVENGTRSLKFSNAHGNEEITCIAFDNTFRRLFTGARDGTIKAWNFQNGNCLHEFESIAEAEVTGIMSFQDRKILATGWSRKITIYDDSDPDIVFIYAGAAWKGGQLHKDDILTIDHCDPCYLVTGSYDGTIIVWNEETEQIVTTLKQNKGSNREKATPVEKLLFLSDRITQDRLSKKLKGGAVLLSSENGTIHLWSVFGHGHHLGKFTATDIAGASVLGMATSPDNSALITGDTAGMVTVWDISNFYLSDSQKAGHEKPAVKHKWKAHDMAIVNVNYIECELLSMLVTSSTDRTARLWTVDGKFIGTFGQKKKWNLKKPSTFQHPRNPWGELVEDPDDPTEEDTMQKTQHVKQTVTFKDEDAGMNNAELTSTITDTTGLPGDGNDSKPSQVESKGVKLPPLPNLKTSGNFKRLPERRMTTHAHAEAKSLPALRKLVKAETVPQFELPKKEKILGETAERGLAKRRATRQERRYRVGFINSNTTSRFGNLCSPFQALSIPDTKSVDFSHHLPMSRRMQERGMACLSETDLGKLPLYSLRDITDQDNDSSTDEASRNPTRRSVRHVSPRRSTLYPGAPHARTAA